MESKDYYLPNYRSLLIGGILIMIGILFTCTAYDKQLSLEENFQQMFIDFSSVIYFFTSLVLLLFKIGFIVLGIFILKNRNKIIRAKTDGNGLYFKEIAQGNRYAQIASDFNDLRFIPYSDIENIYYIKDFWKGDYLEIETKAERKKLTMLNVLSKSDKKEIYGTVQRQIN